jgi:hypothetical protein
MYSVIRYDMTNATVSVDDMGCVLNRCISEIYNNPDRGVPNRISCTVSSADVWSEHIKEILQKIWLMDTAIQYARKHGSTVSLDIAIEPNDYSGLVGSFPIASQLCDYALNNDVQMMISIYR